MNRWDKIPDFTFAKRTCKTVRLQAEAEDVNAGVVQPKDLYSASVIVLPRGRTMCEPPRQWACELRGNGKNAVRDSERLHLCFSHDVM